MAPSCRCVSSQLPPTAASATMKQIASDRALGIRRPNFAAGRMHFWAYSSLASGYSDIRGQAGYPPSSCSRSATARKVSALSSARRARHSTV